MPGVQNIEVTPDEAGQKLLQFLQRRLGRDIPKAAVMRWIRTGQVRVNKGRVKPFDRLDQGDIVRIPPFETDNLHPHLNDPPDTSDVPNVSDTIPRTSSERHTAPGPSEPAEVTADRLAACGLELVAPAEGLLVLHKPAGLPVQTGTGHDDAITTRLAHAFRGAAFMPTPAHRLDRDTSGLLLVATSYTRLQTLHALLREDHAIQKVYLAWVRGRWPHTAPVLLHDILAKRDTGKGERVVQVAKRTAGEKTRRCEIYGDSRKNDHARAASCTVYPVQHAAGSTLLAISLHTGRTHQIRVQLAGRGYPIIGDRKYGDATPTHHASRYGMLLHAWQLMIPQSSATPKDISTSQSISSDVCMKAAGTALPKPDRTYTDVLNPAAVRDAAKGMPVVDNTADMFSCLPQWEKPFSVTAAMLAVVQKALAEDFIQKLQAGHSVQNDAHE